MCIHRWLAAVMIGSAAVLGAVPAAADPPATATSLQLGVGFRYGYELEEGDFNPWGTGIGVEIGYTLPSALYFGGNFDYFLGEEGESLSGNIWQLMAEAGYDLGFGEGPFFVLRPKLGAGVAGYQYELCLDTTSCQSNSETNFAIAPGATFMILTKSVSVALDFRYDMIFADEQLNALIFSVGVGF